MALRCHAKLGEGTQWTLILNQSLNVGFFIQRCDAATAPQHRDMLSGLQRRTRTHLFQWWTRFCSTVQNGCRVGTNSIGTSLTNVFNHRAHSSIPGCSEGTCPITMSAFALPAVTASAAYSTVSHSLVSPTRSNSTLSEARARVSRTKPAEPGLSATLLTFISGFPTTRRTGVSKRFATSTASLSTVVSGIVNKYWFAGF